MGARKRTLTDADRRALARVREFWQDYTKENPGVSQEIAASRAGFTQSAFSQFLLGRVPIGVSPAMKFAKLFGISPMAIREDLAELTYAVPRGATAPSPADGLSNEALEIARAWDRLAVICQDHVRRQIELLRRSEANNSGRRRAVQHDVEIKQGALQSGTRSKRRKGVR